MPKSFNTEISTSIDMTQAQRRLIFKINELGGVETMYDIGYLMADYYNNYVPMGDAENGDKHPGALRDSARVYAGPHRMTLSWGNTAQTKKYARYQFRGKVFRPNRAIWGKGGVINGWYSKKGETKYETNVDLGGPLRTITLYHHRRAYHATIGNTTPGTGSKWTTLARKDHQAWRKFRLDITALLKEKLKEMG